MRAGFGLIARQEQRAERIVHSKYSAVAKALCPFYHLVKNNDGCSLNLCQTGASAMTRTTMSSHPNLLKRRQVLAGAAAGAAALAMPGSIGRARAEGPLKVAAIYTVPVEQQWVSRIHKAANAAVARGDIEYVFSENTSNNDYERVMREYSEAGHDLIIGEVFAVEDAARQVAADYPETAYLMGSSFLPKDDAPNFAVFDNYIQDASYLSGIIAGAMTKSNNIGMVGGFPIPEVNRLMHAFMAGVKETAPETKFQVAFIGSWFDPPKAKETAFAQIDGGADILYAERFGVSDAAKEKGILAIGNVIDTQSDYPDTVVASALWHFEPTLDHAIEMVKAGTFKADNYGVYSFMKEGGCSLAPLGTFEGKVPEEAMKLVAEREAAIKDGSFVVEINDEEPKSS
jgi:basic membrane protein A